MCGHRDQLAHRYNAGAADTRHQQVEAVVDVRDIGVGQVGRILQRLVPQPEDVEVGFVAGDEFVVGEGFPAVDFFGFAAFATVFGFVALDEIIKVTLGQTVLLEGFVDVGAVVKAPKGVLFSLLWHDSP